MEESKIQAKRRDQEENAAAQRAQLLGFEYLDTRPFEKELPLLKDIMSVEDMYKYHMFPLKRIEEFDRGVYYAITSLTPRKIIDNITANLAEIGQVSRFSLVSQSGYKAFMRRFDPPRTVHYDDIEIAKEGDSETFANVSKTLNSVGSDDIMDYIVDQADRLNASDIHIENQRTGIRVRMRVDGALHPVAEIEKDKYRVLMGVLASRAGVSTVAKTSQSGHMQQEIHRDEGSHLLNIRVETIPTLHGQDVVMRLFNFDESLLQLDLLGIQPRERAEIDEVISHPRGMVLMVGPTGSGKSTTLYSMLNALNTTDRKIITLEDPIEYGISGISQIPIDTTGGQNFADGLRSVLRLDPDVVMIGEIRDIDTAKTAIQASITGHLVLSSFHANSTSAAFSRMIDLIGVNPIFSTAIRLIIAQRLVRKLYKESAEEYTPDEATVKWIKEVLKDLPDHIDPPDYDNLKLWRPRPTADVPFGFKGRIVIMEQMVVNEDIQKFIRGDLMDVNVTEIEKTAKKSGMITLMQAGVLAALRGDTTIEEVNRAI